MEARRAAAEVEEVEAVEAREGGGGGAAGAGGGGGGGRGGGGGGGGGRGGAGAYVTDHEAELVEQDTARAVVVDAAEELEPRARGGVGREARGVLQHAVELLRQLQHLLRRRRLHAVEARVLARELPRLLDARARELGVALGRPLPPRDLIELRLGGREAGEGRAGGG